MNSFTEENYLKAIYKLSENQDSEVSTNAIAAMMNTKAASVTDMLRKLSDKKLINYVKYQGVTLTPKGGKIAINIIRKHRLWEFFLVSKLGFKWDEVHDLAEEMEHINSDKLIDRLDAYLDYPKYDPHGDPIPSKNGTFTNRKMYALAESAENFEGMIAGVSDHSPLFLQYLDKVKIQLGSSIQIVEYNEYDGSMLIRVDQGQEFQISNEVAKNLLVFRN